MPRRGGRAPRPSPAPVAVVSLLRRVERTRRALCTRIGTPPGGFAAPVKDWPFDGHGAPASRWTSRARVEARSQTRHAGPRPPPLAAIHRLGAERPGGHAAVRQVLFLTAIVAGFGCPASGSCTLGWLARHRPLVESLGRHCLPPFRTMDLSCSAGARPTTESPRYLPFPARGKVVGLENGARSGFGYEQMTNAVLLLRWPRAAWGRRGGSFSSLLRCTGGDAFPATARSRPPVPTRRTARAVEAVLNAYR